MIYLTLSVVASSTIYLLFKSIAGKKISSWNVIIINYLVASTMGFLIGGFKLSFLSMDWFPYALIMGIVFVMLFNFMAMSTRWIGAGPTVVANKMSVIIPVYFAYVLYDDDLSTQKIVGLVLVIISVLLTSGMNGKSTSVPRWAYILPWIIFIGSGGIDTVLKYLEVHYLKGDDMIHFTPFLFLSAFVSGIIVMVFKGKTFVSLIEPATLKYGSLLGLVNFGSIYFLLKALQDSGLQSSVVFPVNNTGIMIMSTFGSFLLFQEKLNAVRWIGFVLAIIAIGIIYWS